MAKFCSICGRNFLLFEKRIDYSDKDGNYLFSNCKKCDEQAELMKEEKENAESTLKELVLKYISGKDFNFKHTLFFTHRWKSETGHIYELKTAGSLDKTLSNYANVIDICNNRKKWQKKINEGYLMQCINNEKYYEWGYEFYNDLNKILLLLKQKTHITSIDPFVEDSIDYMVEIIEPEQMIFYNKLLEPILKNESLTGISESLTGNDIDEKTKSIRLF